MTSLPAANGRIYIVRDATIHDIDALFSNMREADMNELIAGAGNPYRALKLSYLGSVLCKAVECDDGLICVYGAASVSWSEGIGCPWMLGTRLLDGKHKRAVLAIGRECLDSMRALFPVRLENYTDARNHKSIRWLKWLGFRFDEPVPYGVSGEPFYPFSMGDKPCATLH
jgi:hypothetical protein